ncbi:ribosome modulation factor [Methylobacterium sp. CB376]|uniref:ribosome modulation factor n=1 Tax=unclassified Methylobacterium TaxID=2615210 RepID=UPI0002EA98DE|nr:MULTISPECIES: Rmf/CrpP family protein [Methylobacterium]WFT80060.1 ribosome modulation factor [Methylobacterium nodulans]
MTDVPDDHLDHYTLGYFAPTKGLRREDCPYAAGTPANALWLAGYDAARAGEAPPERPAPPPGEAGGR